MLGNCLCPQKEELDPKRDLPAHASEKVAGEIDADPNAHRKEEPVKEDKKKDDDDKKSHGWGDIFKPKHKHHLTNYDCKYSYTRKQCEPVEHCKYKYQVTTGFMHMLVSAC
jgi:hypothetical protein